MPSTGNGDDDPVTAGKGNSSFLSFWTTLPGILTGAAALLTALIGLLAALDVGRPATLTTPSPSNVLRSQAAGSDPPARFTSSPDAAPSTAASTSGTVSGAAVANSGTVSMSSSERVDLRTGQITSAVVGADLYLSCGGTTCLLQWRLTQVPSAGSKAVCVDALRKRTLDSIEVTGLRPGAELCVQTHDFNVAGLRLTQIPGAGSPQLVFDYTLWD